MHDLVIQFYKEGLYTTDDMKLFVEVQWISADEYKQLTGTDYVA